MSHGSLNPLYNVEPLLITPRPSLWGEPDEIGLNPLYNVEPLLMVPTSAVPTSAVPTVLIHSTTWNHF